MLRIVGPLIAVTGLLFIIIGIASFFAAFGSVEHPRYFWCAFVGTVMCMFGYLGSFYRFIAGESAPVAKDVINYLGTERSLE